MSGFEPGFAAFEMCATRSLIFPSFKMGTLMLILKSQWDEEQMKSYCGDQNEDGGGDQNEDDDKEMVQPVPDGLWNMGLTM